MVLVLAACCFTGCRKKLDGNVAGGKGNTSKDIKVSYWNAGYGSAWIEQMAERFEKDFPEYNVELNITASRGAVIGCFDYAGKQAFYVSSNSFDEAQTVTLNFNKAHSLELISTGLDTTVTASRYTLNLGKGEAVLVVVD